VKGKKCRGRGRGGVEEVKLREEKEGIYILDVNEYEHV